MNTAEESGANWVIAKIEEGKTRDEIYQLLTGGLPEETINSEFHQSGIKILKLLTG